jgi:hypothetical protein
MTKVAFTLRLKQLFMKHVRAAHAQDREMITTCHDRLEHADTIGEVLSVIRWAWDGDEPQVLSVCLQAAGVEGVNGGDTI